MTPQPHSKTHILHLNRTEGSGVTSINETSCWRKSQKMRTDHPTIEQHRRAETQAPVGEGGGSLAQIQNHIQKDSHTRGGVKQWALRWHTCTTHTQHFISYLLIFVPSQGFPMTKRRGWKFFTCLPRVHERTTDTPHLLSVHLFQDGIQ